MSIEIITTNGFVTLISEQDYRFCAVPWFARYDKNRVQYPYYVQGRYRIRPNHWKTIALHREIMQEMLGRPLLPTELVDHISRDGLDNRRENLRLSTPSQNQGNQAMRKDNTSGLRGVSFHSTKKVWTAQIGMGGKVVEIGTFRTKEEAREAYLEVAQKHFGEFLGQVIKHT